MTVLNKNQRVILIFIGLSLFAMLSASLWQRFVHPGLTISRHGSAASGPAIGGIGQLMQAVSKNPEDIGAIIELVESLMAIGQWEGAENFAQKAMAIDAGSDRNRRAQYLLAVIHHNQGRHEQAAEILEKLLAQAENPSARYSLGILYLHYLNKREAGLEQLRKGLEAPDLSPGLAEAISGELDKAENKDK